MKKILVCQHVAHELLGTLNPLLKSHGFRIKYINFGRDPKAQPSLEGTDGLILLGGPMNVDDVDRYPHLAHEVILIQQAVAKELPVFGICLGAQLIAKALGGTVTKNRVKEIGWYDLDLTTEGKKDPLFLHFNPREKIFQWHGDTFSIPPGAVHLASSPDCATQAFRYHSNVYGFQFHLEVDEPMIHRWLNVAENKKEVADPSQILAETPEHIGRLQTLAHQNFGELAKIFGAEKKFKLLPSR